MQIDSEGEYTITQVVEGELHEETHLYRRIKSTESLHDSPRWERWISSKSSWKDVASLDDATQEDLEQRYLNEKHYQKELR